MFYINSPEEKLQSLVQAMFHYLIGLHKENSELLPLFGVQGLQGIQLMTYLAHEVTKEPVDDPEIADSKKESSSHPPIILIPGSLHLLDELQQTLIQSLFSKPQNPTSQYSHWLSKTYPNIFQLPSFYELLSSFFNSSPPELSPTLFKTLLFAILHDNSSTGPAQNEDQENVSNQDNLPTIATSASEPKREFMNSMTEILPCIVRWEIEEPPLDETSGFYASLKG